MISESYKKHWKLLSTENGGIYIYFNVKCVNCVAQSSFIPAPNLLHMLTTD